MKFTHRSVDGVFHFKTNDQGFRNDTVPPEPLLSLFPQSAMFFSVKVIC